MNKQTKILIKDMNAKIKKLERASKATMQSVREIKDQCILIEQALAEKDEQVAEKNEPVAEKNKPAVVRKPREGLELQNILNSLLPEDRLNFIEKYLK